MTIVDVAVSDCHVYFASEDMENAVENKSRKFTLNHHILFHFIYLFFTWEAYRAIGT